MRASRRSSPERSPLARRRPGVDASDDPTDGPPCIRSGNPDSTQGRSGGLSQPGSTGIRTAPDLWIELLAEIIASEVWKEADHAEASGRSTQREGGQTP